MKKSICFLLKMAALWAASYSLHAKAEKQMHEFINLIVSDKPVLLSEYIKFYGPNSETELTFELQRCEENSWKAKSKDCLSWINNRWKNQRHSHSLFFTWLKKQFATKGENYKVIKIINKKDTLTYSLIDVKIGKHLFVIFRNDSKNTPTGILLAIDSINGKKIKDLVNKLNKSKQPL